MHKIKVWVEAMDETREEVLELNMTREEWLSLTEEQREKYVEDWAYEVIQMGYGYEGVD